jgi:methionine aminopeptidase
MPKTSAGNKLRISITILPMINEMLEKVSKRSGISKSLLAEMALKDYLKKQMEDDIKTLSKLKFDDLPSEDDWLKIQSKF